MRIADLGANAVSLWGERGAATINQPPSPSGMPEERRPIYLAGETLGVEVARIVARRLDDRR